MHDHSVSAWRHDHVFLGDTHNRNEIRTWFVVALTTATMAAEIVAGSVFGSIALTADGWHMSTHAAALAIAALAYRLASRHARDERFSFGTGKLGELAGFASAIILALVAVLIGYESVVRLFQPVAIRFDEAAAVAVIGLLVNLVSAWLLWDHEHHHGHGHGEHEHIHDHDNNLRAAFTHVLADALTSILAIAALLGGRVLGWAWLDAAIGIVGALVILRWSYGLIVSSGKTLLDMVPDGHLAERLRDHLETKGDKLADLHLWRLGPGHVGVIASIVSDDPKEPNVYKQRLGNLRGLSHVTVEVYRCRNHEPGRPIDAVSG
jgi:cation diffusion facilitator family transporter